MFGLAAYPARPAFEDMRPKVAYGIQGRSPVGGLGARPQFGMGVPPTAARP